MYFEEARRFTSTSSRNSNIKRYKEGRSSRKQRSPPNMVGVLSSNKLKYLAYGVCTVICVYQIFLYLATYFQYSTSVDAEVAINDIPTIPASTICYNQRIVGAMMCNETGKHCNSPYIEVDEAAEFVNARKDKIPMISNCFYNYGNNTKVSLNKTTCPGFWLYNGFHMCVVLNSEWKPIREIKEDFAEFSYEINCIFSERQGKFILGVDIFIHSTQKVPSRSLRTYFVSVGDGFKANFQKTIVKRLPPPYKTKCFKYNEARNKHDTFRNMGQDPCLYDCMWKNLTSLCGCIPKPITSFSGFPNCDQNQTEKCLRRVNEIRSNCLSSCPQACLTDYYDFTIAKIFANRNEDSYNKILIFMELRGCVEVTFIHKPQIQFVEVFSYIGGFLGIWLGVCVPQLFELFATIVCYSRRKVGCYITEYDKRTKR